MLSYTQKQKGEAKGCSVQFTPDFSLLQLCTDTNPVSSTHSVCYQVTAWQRAAKHHPSATKATPKVRAISKTARTQKKFKVTSKRVCMAEKPAALNAVTAY